MIGGEAIAIGFLLILMLVAMLRKSIRGRRAKRREVMERLGRAISEMTEIEQIFKGMP